MLLEQFELRILAVENNTDKIRELISAKGWEWYHSHKNDHLATFFFGLVSVKVSHVKVIFEKLFGPDPL